MFNLSEADLRLRILGVGDGPASFNARMKGAGQTVTSIDPSYELTAAEFKRRINDTYDVVMNQTRKNLDKFIWLKFKNLDELGKVRMSAMNEFCEDLDQGKAEGRYIAASLPRLPAANKSYDLILSAHLLFFYSDHCSLDFHRKSVRELIRVGREIRIFPLVDLESNESPHLGSVIEDLESAHIPFSIEKVRYHFQRTGDEMLRIFTGSSVMK